MFWEGTNRHAALVQVMKDHLLHVSFQGVKFWVLLYYVLLSFHTMHQLWCKKDLLSDAKVRVLEENSDCWQIVGGSGTHCACTMQLFLFR